MVDVLLFEFEVLAFLANNERSRCWLSVRRGMKRSGMHDGEFNLLVGESGDEDIRPPKCSADAGLSRLSTILFGVVCAECGCVRARGLEDAIESRM